MTNFCSPTTRVLAIDPTTRGFAYVVLEGPELLLDWGVTQVMPAQKNRLCLKRAQELLVRYMPDVVLLEAYDGKGSHRRPRVRSLIRSIRRLALQRQARARAFSRGEIRRSFEGIGKATKHPIALEIARRFPELRERLPRARKFYETEDERMSIFDAASLAVTYFKSRNRAEPQAEITKSPLAA